ncbi:MAG: zinc-binding dehydrogenase [Candidatus Azotimanducaceae bacterium]
MQSLPQPGGVGSIAIQLAKIAGCKTIGIAGGPRKTAVLREKLGVEIALDYKNTDLASHLTSAAPKGINVFFDNVGGDVLDAVLINLAKFGRVAVCGGIGGYDKAETVVRNTTLLTQKNGLVQGFWYSDYEHIFERALDSMSDWILSGELQEFTDVAKGFESVPRSARGIFSGENLGKQLVELF